jgi:hypothetical protein
VDRTVAQARRTVEETALRAKQYTQHGPVGELAQLRLSLRTSMRATQEALWTAAPQDASLSEALGLFQRLSAHGRELDDDLKRLEREPDQGRLAARLPELRERTERIVHHADSLRWAAQDRALQFADDDLASLGRQIDVEAGALRHWSPGTEPRAGSGSGAAAAAAGAGAAARSGGTGRGGDPSSASTGSSAWPDVSQPDAVSQEPPAITARDPRQQTAYPWQKASRPESTT